MEQAHPNSLPCFGRETGSCVVARRGSCVLMFSYTGHEDLRTETAYFAALLSG